MTCPKCGTIQLRPSAKFCPKDGAPLQSIPKCPACNAMVWVDWDYCAECGVNLFTPKRGEASAKAAR